MCLLDMPSKGIREDSSYRIGNLFFFATIFSTVFAPFQFLNSRICFVLFQFRREMRRRYDGHERFSVWKQNNERVLDFGEG